MRSSTGIGCRAGLMALKPMVEQADPVRHPAHRFRHDARQAEGFQAGPDRFEDTQDDAAAPRSSVAFARATCLTIQSRAPVEAFREVVRRGHLRSQDKREEFVVTHQLYQLVGKIGKLAVGRRHFGRGFPPVRIAKSLEALLEYGHTPLTASGTKALVGGSTLRIAIQGEQTVQESSVLLLARI